MAEKRLKKEFQLIFKQEKEIKVRLINEDIRHWKAIIKGPIETIYEGGHF